MASLSDSMPHMPHLAGRGADARTPAPPAVRTHIGSSIPSAIMMANVAQLQVKATAIPSAMARSLFGDVRMDLETMLLFPHDVSGSPRLSGQWRKSSECFCAGKVKPQFNGCGKPVTRQRTNEACSRIAKSHRRRGQP